MRRLWRTVRHSKAQLHLLCHCHGGSWAAGISFECLRHAVWWVVAQNDEASSVTAAYVAAAGASTAHNSVGAHRAHSGTTTQMAGHGTDHV